MKENRNLPPRRCQSQKPRPWRMKVGRSAAVVPGSASRDGCIYNGREGGSEAGLSTAVTSNNPPGPMTGVGILDSTLIEVVDKRQSRMEWSTSSRRGCHGRPPSQARRLKKASPKLFVPSKQTEQKHITDLFSISTSNPRGQSPLYSFHWRHASLRRLLHHHQKHYSDLPLQWYQIGARPRIYTDLV
jgi:hypothetical protein